MSEIAGIQKLFQDLIDPDLRALAESAKNATEVANIRHSELLARIDASESRTESLIDKTNNEIAMLRVEMSRRFEAQDAKFAVIDLKIQNLTAKLELEKGSRESKPVRAFHTSRLTSNPPQLS